MLEQSPQWEVELRDRADEDANRNDEPQPVLLQDTYIFIGQSLRCQQNEFMCV